MQSAADLLHTPTRAVKSDAGQILARIAAFALGLLLPTLVYRPLAATPAPGILDVYVRPGVYLTDAAAIVVVALGLFSLRGRGVLLASGNLILPVLALAGLALVAAPLALSPTVAAYTALRWALAGALLAALMAADLPLDRLLTGLLAGLAVNALLGIVQTLAQAPLGLPGELTLPRHLSGAAVIGPGRWLRPYGLTFHPNVLAGFLVVGLLITLPRLARPYVKFLWWLCWAALLLTFSRSAWLALALTLPPLALWLAVAAPLLRRPLAVTAIGGLVIAATLLVTLRPVLQARLAVDDTLSGPRPSAANRSLNERLELQTVALAVIAQTPLVGVGAGNSPLAVQTTQANADPQPIHNLPLLLAAEVGVLGGGLWIWLWFAPLVLVLARRAGRRGAAAGWHDPLGPPLAFALAWLALGLIGLLDFYPWGLESGRLLSVVMLAFFARSFHTP